MSVARFDVFAADISAEDRLTSSIVPLPKISRSLQPARARDNFLHICALWSRHAAGQPGPAGITSGGHYTDTGGTFTFHIRFGSSIPRIVIMWTCCMETIRQFCKNRMKIEQDSPLKSFPRLPRAVLLVARLSAAGPGRCQGCDEMLGRQEAEQTHTGPPGPGWAARHRSGAA